MIGVFDHSLKPGDIATIYTGPDSSECEPQPVVIVRESSLEEYLKLYPCVSLLGLRNWGFDSAFFYEFLTD